MKLLGYQPTDPMRSQGTCVVAGALGEVDDAVKNQVKGAVLFGYTKNLQYGERIPGFPASKTAIYCDPGDAVCFGTLFILPGHVFYFDEASDEAPAFLIQQVG
jgi:cutinase